MEIYLGNTEIQKIIREIHDFNFSGGEAHIRIDVDEDAHYSNAMIIVYDYTSNGIMQLLMVTDALRRWYNGIEISVEMTYLPYARQDKCTVKGEALSIKVFADLINSQKYKQVICADVHSDVARALINNLVEIKQHDIAYSVLSEQFKKGVICPDNVSLLAPDTGAAKKIYELSKKLASELNVNTDVILAEKVRNSIGEVVSTRVFCDDFQGKDVFIIDDIIDGGRTFIELCKALEGKNHGKIYLYATHGIFSKGVDCLIDAGISHIFTTFSFKPIEHEKVSQLEF